MSQHPLQPIQGGTGISNNNASTLTISGNFPLTFTLTAPTNVSFPTSGTLITSATNITPSQLPAFSGDASSLAGTSVLTLATVNGNVGTFASVTVNGKGLVTAAAALSGDATTSSSVITLATVNSNVGTFGDASHVGTFTVNGKGLITAASSTAIAIASGAVSGLAASATTDTTNASNISSGTLPNGRLTGVYTGVTGLGAQSQALNMNGNLINNIATPVSSNDATNKAYVDAVASGISWKNSVKASTTANLSGTYVGSPTFTLTNNGVQAAFAVDGYSASSGDRILVKNQTTQSQNGIYSVTTVGNGSTNWVLTRTSDFNEVTPIDEINGAAVYVQQGTLYSNTGWTQIDHVVTFDTDNIAWAQFSGTSSGVSSLTAGATSTTTGISFSSSTGAVTANGVAFTSSNQGMAPASGGGTTNFLRADGTWAAAGSSALTSTQIAYGNGSNAITSSADFTWTEATNPTLTMGAAGTSTVTVKITNATTNGATLAITGSNAGTATDTGGAITITSGTGNTSGAGGAATLQAGTGGASNGAGGTATLQGGTAGATNGAGGQVTLQGGAGLGTGIGGSININGGNLSTSATNSIAAGNVLINPGSLGSGTSGTTGYLSMYPSAVATGGAPTAGAILNGLSSIISANTGQVPSTTSVFLGGTPYQLNSGNAMTTITGGLGNVVVLGGGVSGTSVTSGTNTGGSVYILGGSALASTISGSATVHGGALFLDGGNGVGTNANGGNVTIAAGTKTGVGTAGVINLSIPATGALQINASAGTSGQALISQGATSAPVWGSPTTAALTATQVGYGSGTGTLVGTTDFTWTEATNPTLTIGNASSTTVTLKITDGTTNGANFVVTGSAAGTATDNGGNVTMTAGTGNTTGTGGNAVLNGGTGGGSNGQGGNVNLTAGAGGATNGIGGSININGGIGTGTGNAGVVNITGGNSSTTGAGGNLILSGGATSTGTVNGTVQISGAFVNAGATVGAVRLFGGAAAGSGTTTLNSNGFLGANQTTFMGNASVFIDGAEVQSTTTPNNGGGVFVTGGAINVTSGTAANGSTGGNVSIFGGFSLNASNAIASGAQYPGGSVTIQGGAGVANATSVTAGNVTIAGGITQITTSGTGTTGQIVFQTAPSTGAGTATLATRLTIANTGALTIATPSSGTPLTINTTSGGTVVSFADGTGTGSIAFSAGHLQLGSDATHPLDLFTNGSTRLTINSTGNATVNAPSSGTALTVTAVSNGIGANISGTTVLNAQDNVTTVSAAGVTTTINCAVQNVEEITLGAGSNTITFSNPPAANTSQTMTIILIQDATGSRLLPTFSQTINWNNGVTPTLTTTANKVDVLQIWIVNNGTNTKYYGSQILNNMSNT